MIILFIIGFIDNCREIVRLNNNIDFSNEFLNKFRLFIESKCRDNITYEWILKNSTHMQEILGSHGIMSYKDSYANYIINNYQIIINIIPEIVQTALSSHSSLFGEALNTKTRTISEVILRYIGATEDARSIYISRIKKPFHLFSDGWFIVISIPLKILRSFGIISSGIYSTVGTSIIYKLILFVAFCLGIYADILSVKQGHPSFFDDAWQAVKGIFTNL